MRLLLRVLAWLVVGVVAAGHLSGVAGAVVEAPLTVRGDVTGLGPGQTGRLAVTVSNPGEVPAVVRQLHTEVTGGAPGCGPDGLRVDPWQGRLVVPAHGTASVVLPVTVAAEAACGGVSWSLAYTAT